MDAQLIARMISPASGQKEGIVKDVEAVLLRIPGVVEAQVFAKVLVRCEFPMAEDTITGLQAVEDWIEHETGWKVEMTVSAGKEPDPITHGVSGQDIANWEKARKAVADLHERNLQGWTT